MVNHERIGRVIFRGGRSVEITSIMDSFDASGRVTTVRIPNGNIYVRTVSKTGLTKYFYMNDYTLVPWNNVESFDLE